MQKARSCSLNKIKSEEKREWLFNKGIVALRKLENVVSNS